MMNYLFRKLKFQTGVHFGDGGLMTCTNVLCADTVFSALCIEAAKNSPEILDDLVQKAKSGQLLISDALPYIEDRLYVPRPILKIKTDREGDPTLKKELKKLEYVPADQLEAYTKGKLNIQKEASFFSEHYGSYYMIERAAVTGLENARPYGIEAFRYGPDSGLYLCIGYEEKSDLYLIEELLDSLQYSGIGGKINSGLGRFELYPVKGDNGLVKRFQLSGFRKYMSLSVCMAADDELENALDKSEYLLLKRSGFVSSSTYAATLHKRRDLYLFSTGSIFRHVFHGAVFDVSDGGAHPVYRYAKTMMMGVI